MIKKNTKLFEQLQIHMSKLLGFLTEVRDWVAGFVKSAGVELQPDDGEDDNGEHDEEADLH